MNVSLTYIMLFLGHLCVCFYFNKDIQFKKPKLQSKQKPNTLVVPDNIEHNKHFLLSKNLKHLELIANFEMYLEQKTLKDFSLEFLQEFEQIKIEAQLSALKTTNQLNTTVKITD